MSGLDLYLSQRVLAMMLVWAFAAGLGLGILYDLLRLLRLLMTTASHGDGSSPKRGSSVWAAALRFLFDLVFMLVAAVTLILLCYYTNDGQPRAPAFLGMAGGFFVWYHTLGRLFRIIALPLSVCLRRAVLAAIRLLAWPFRELFRLLCLLLRLLWQGTIGKLIAGLREHDTEERIKALTQAASEGFGVMSGTRETDEKK